MLWLGEEPVRGEDLEPGILGRDENDGHLRAGRESLLLAEGDRRLVAVVAVGDQELLVVEVADEHRVVDPPELRAFDLQIRLSLGPLDRGGAVVEQEDRLQLDARCPQQAESRLLRAGVGALVR